MTQNPRKTGGRGEDEVTEAEVIYDDGWQDLDDLARKVGRAAENILPTPRADQVKNVTDVVQATAKVGRKVEAAARDIKVTVERIEEKLPFKIVSSKPSPRG